MTEGSAAMREGGWYLYGITQHGDLEAALAEPDDAAPLRLLDCSGLAAVVRPVLLADFSPDVLRERLRSAPDVEAIVRSHNRVIEAIHARQPILPAKFGSVYAHAEDIVSALRFARDTLLPQLRRLEGCDEWAVHLYAEAAVVREKVTREDPAIRRLRDERGAARPGRAYFLEQKLLDELKAATEQALVTLAQDVFERLAGYAVGRQVNKVRSVDQSADELEILSASFLVSRTRVERFKEEARSCADTGDGLRCEYSGPWPPYSFAVGDEGNAR